MVAAKVICIYINRPWERVAAFLADPLTMNHWASGLGRSLRHDHGRWRAKGPAGSVFIRFSPPNAFGVADHWVDMADGESCAELQECEVGHGPLACCFVEQQCIHIQLDREHSDHHQN